MKDEPRKIDVPYPVNFFTPYDDEDDIQELSLEDETELKSKEIINLVEKLAHEKSLKLYNKLEYPFLYGFLKESLFDEIWDLLYQIGKLKESLNRKS